MAYQRRALIIKQELTPIFFFMIPPVVGAAFQVLFYGLSLIWPLVTLSILFVFIRLQNKLLFTDHLTGLFNRRELDRYLRNSLLGNGGTLGGLMIDLDSFKKINDDFGHNVGDQALIDTAEILKRTFRKNDFIARYGGDEFIVIIDIARKNDLKKAVDRLDENVTLFNRKKTAPYTISLSVGYDFLLDKSKSEIKDFIKHLDELMYENKHESEPQNSALKEASE
jgi:diguanylate cyclase (GGDEF)-like protein